jgi:mannosylglycoprotein endo-beta-mannosidase
MIPLYVGGLGIRNIKLFNTALLSKWLWRFAMERDRLWRRVIAAKYGCMIGDWHTSVGRGPYGVSLWRFISKGWGVFSKHIRFKVGSGAQISFWHDVWCGELPLSITFPMVYSVSHCKEAMVAEYLIEVGGDVTWNVPFSRAANDWELEEFEAFFALVYEASISRGEEDVLEWTGSKDDKFSVKSMYDGLTRGGDPSFPWKEVWRSLCPMRVSFFVWEAALGRSLTSDNLRRRGFIIADWCFLCRCSGESVNHVLLHCPYACELWTHVLNILNLHWVMPETVAEMLRCWKRRLRNPFAQAIWRMIPHCIWWCLWRERNRRCFEDCSLSLDRLQGVFLSLLFSLGNSVFGCPFLDFDDFVSFLACLE